MRRVRPRPQDAPVTLLPFLAVLICTMGALIVLLVVVVQQARVEATEVVSIDEPPTPTDATQLTPPPNNEPLASEEAIELPQLLPAGPTPEEVSRAQQERDKYLWEIQMLAESRERTQQRLSEKRLVLSHLEEHTRRLTAQLDQLEQDAQQTGAGQSDAPLAAIHAELARIEQQITAKEQQLKSAQQLAASRSGTYQLVPYTGSRGTTRRPIYVECLPDAVIIQPEGVRLDADDFMLTRSAGNPLAAALRAVREYWLKTAGDTKRGEPYPLLVVRPGGETAYGACRQALRSWDDEFGYELIPNGLTLSYPPADDRLAAEIERAVGLSRQQQQKMKGLIAIQKSGGPVYRASRQNGGFVREGGPSRSTGKSSFSGSNFTGSNFTGSGSKSARASASGSGSRSAQASSSGSKSVVPPSQNGTAALAPRTSGETSNDSLTLGSPTDGNPVDGNHAENDRASSFQPMPSAVNSYASSTSSSTSSQVTKSQGGNATPASLAGTRGRDWALPNVARGAIPIRRPLYVTVNSDQLVLQAEPGTNEVPLAISFGHGTVDAVQSMVTSIWQRIEDWGVAGPGVYWKPTMEVAVTPDGEMRFRELASLLQDSGIELQRR